MLVRLDLNLIVSLFQHKCEVSETVSTTTLYTFVFQCTGVVQSTCTCSRIICFISVASIMYVFHYVCKLASARNNCQIHGPCNLQVRIGSLLEAPNCSASLCCVLSLLPWKWDAANAALKPHITVVWNHEVNLWHAHVLYNAYTCIAYMYTVS